MKKSIFGIWSAFALIVSAAPLTYGNSAVAKILNPDMCVEAALGHSAGVYSRQESQAAMAQIKQTLREHVVGQEEFIQRILMALTVTKGHILVEGLPGLAKTRTLKTLAKATTGSFGRLQFTSDVSASDITMQYKEDPDRTGHYSYVPGPIYNNFVLADEINRGSERAQGGFLEAMEEGQITLPSGTYSLPKFFFVMATQNPISDLGTNGLPIAQLDRFLMKVIVRYPEFEEERQILEMHTAEELAASDASESVVQREIKKVPVEVLEAIKLDRARVIVPTDIKNYILNIVRFTRPAEAAALGIHQLKILAGPSPRASMALQSLGQAAAWLDNRSEVTLDDVDVALFEVLRHRILLDNSSAMLRNTSVEQVIEAARVKARAITAGGQ